MTATAEVDPAEKAGGRVEPAPGPLCSDVGDLSKLTDLVRAGGVLILSGAGLSTESGIPDYRGPTGSARGFTPITYQAFTADAQARSRYWARSYLGWPHIAAAAPNEGHHAVTALQGAGLLAGVITQNVDGLDLVAGTREVVELHGGLRNVVCLGCGQLTPRAHLQVRLGAANPDWAATVTVPAGIRPDGDADADDATGFHVVDCVTCGGTLKPDVVFFGESVPVDRVRRCVTLLAGARALLVVGSSLTVLSGRRFVLSAARVGTPVALVNQGPSRGEEYATIRIDAPLGQVLPTLRALATR